jgi:hypothetical protein
MAIDYLYFDIMCTVIDLERKNKSSQDSVLQVGCLSYPDILVSREQIIHRYPELKNETYITREDSEKIKKWHSMPHLKKIIETTDFFNKLGCVVDYFDFEEIRGGEIKCDLNLPIGRDHYSKYDIVIDTGTLEHCFNVGVAFENMCRLSKIGGIIISAAPMTKINHGFWNFSPCAYENYFMQNNFEILFLSGFYKDKEGLKQLEVSPNGRQVVPQESLLISVARRLEGSTFKLPIQQKYL